MSLSLPAGVQINAPIQPGFETVLTPEALAFVAQLHRAFEPRRQQLLAARAERAQRLDAGERPDFLPETAHVRAGDWKVAPVPPALQCRRRPTSRGIASPRSLASTTTGPRRSWRRSAVSRSRRSRT